ncbi:hypothetical protein B0J14DRAFT_646490 [Halenospora varia]|nr:hypothetical protein B0J14DRAFT_646490 [Halenospora varia]
MVNFQQLFAFLALAAFSQGAALPDPQITPAPDANAVKHSCFSYTSTAPFTGIIHCPLIKCGPHPMCIIQQTTTLSVPAPDKKCPVTPTVTVTAPGKCPGCQTGCATNLVTTTVTAAPTY